jgi:hypothetical protein
VSRPIEVVVLNCWRDRHEADAVAVEDLDHAGEVGEGPRQPVDLVDDDDVDAVAGHVIQKVLGRAGRSMVPPDTPPSSYRVAMAVQPSPAWLRTKASQAARWASRLLKSCSSPSSLALAGVDGAVADGSLRHAGSVLNGSACDDYSLGPRLQTEEHGAGPLLAGDLAGDAGQALPSFRPFHSKPASVTSTSWVVPCHWRISRVPALGRAAAGVIGLASLPPDATCLSWRARAGFQAAPALFLEAVGQRPHQQVPAHLPERWPAIGPGPFRHQHLPVQGVEAVEIVVEVLIALTTSLHHWLLFFGVEASR